MVVSPSLSKPSRVKSYNRAVVPPAASRAEVLAAEIIELLQTQGCAPYDGGPVSHRAHAVQCAMLAMETLNDLPVIIGALLHDVGYLLHNEMACKTIPADKAALGAAYLRRMGFSDRVCAMAAQHTIGKRYLLATTKEYEALLSPRNLKQLHAQGGSLTATEAAAFEQQPYFADVIRVCRWDVAAKKRNAVLLPLSFFRRLLWDHLSRTTL